MEENNATLLGSPHTPISTAAGGGIVPPPPPLSIRTTVVPTPTTLPTFPSIQNMLGAPFSYGMPGFDSNSIITYSTLQTIGPGEGSLMLPWKDPPWA
jgi:hypothetical protein